MTKILECSVRLDEFTAKACEPFDYKFDGTSRFTVPDFQPPTDFSLGLIVGPSGSGKSSLLREHFGVPSVPVWNPELSVVSQIADTPSEAVEKLSAVGLNSVPSWCKPRHVLSNGEGFRADLARMVADGSVIDEFTSVVDRTVAKAASVGLRRLVDRKGFRRVVAASCHYDIIEWLQPDWVFDVSTGVTTPRGSLQPRPKIELEIVPCDRQVWPIFAPHHYLTETIPSNAQCWSVWWGDAIVGFTSDAPLVGRIRNARREARTVVMPDFQGLGIGVRVSDAIAEQRCREGKRYYSKTAHPRMGQYRNRHPNWKPTSMNGKRRLPKIDYSGDDHNLRSADTTECFSHEYVLTPRGN